jgi:prophage regulatory protein
MLQLPETGFLRLVDIIGDRRKGISGLFPVSRTAWYAGVKSKLYPQPIKLGPRTTAYDIQAVRSLIESTRVTHPVELEAQP